MPPPPPASPPPIDMGGARRPALGTLAAGIGRVSGLAPMQLLRPADRPIGPGAGGVAISRDALEVCVRRRPQTTPPWPPTWPPPARAKTSSSRWLCMLSRWLCMREATPKEPYGALPASPAPPPAPPRALPPAPPHALPPLPPRACDASASRIIASRAASRDASRGVIRGAPPASTPTPANRRTPGAIGGGGGPPSVVPGTLSIAGGGRGLLTMCWHRGTCLSQAAGAKVRPQCGQASKRSAPRLPPPYAPAPPPLFDAAPRPPLPPLPPLPPPPPPPPARPPPRAARMASRNANDSCRQWDEAGRRGAAEVARALHVPLTRRACCIGLRARELPNAAANCGLRAGPCLRPAQMYWCFAMRSGLNLRPHRAHGTRPSMSTG